MLSTQLQDERADLIDPPVWQARVPRGTLADGLQGLLVALRAERVTPRVEQQVLECAISSSFIRVKCIVSCNPLMSCQLMHCLPKESLL